MHSMFNLNVSMFESNIVFMFDLSYIVKEEVETSKDK